jgi:hypothetical protein
MGGRQFSFPGYTSHLIEQNLLGYTVNPANPKSSAHEHSILEFSIDPFKHKFGRMTGEYSHTT